MILSAFINVSLTTPNLHQILHIIFKLFVFFYINNLLIHVTREYLTTISNNSLSTQHQQQQAMVIKTTVITDHNKQHLERQQENQQHAEEATSKFEKLMNINFHFSSWIWILKRFSSSGGGEVRDELIMNY